MGGAGGWCVCVCLEVGGAADLRALANTKGPGPPPHMPNTIPQP